MTRHVGARVSALVDGQLPPDEAERLWAHVHVCPPCRARVEHEGWVKTTLAGLALAAPAPSPPDGLKGSLAGVCSSEGPPLPYAAPVAAERRRTVAVAVLGAGSIGAAMVGVLAMTVPAQTPGVERRGPVTSLTRPTTSTPVQTTSARAGSPLTAALRLARVGADQQEWVTITP